MNNMLFDPTRNFAEENAEQRKHFTLVETWVLDCIETRSDAENDGTVQVALQEVACSEPFCNPINLLCTLFFSCNDSEHNNSTCSYTLKIPVSAEDCTPELIQDVMPPAVILEKLQQGNKDYSLRYFVGTKVQAKVAQDTWLPGSISAQWFRHPRWPEKLYVPYKVKLLDGRAITVPHDDDACVVYDKDAKHGGSCC